MLEGGAARDVIQSCIYMTMQQPFNSFTQPNIPAECRVSCAERLQELNE